ncbi:hypothetical protein ACFLZV_04795 [Candidatus Margulisiibacteriota bacterium]
MVVQDDSRENELIKLFKLSKPLNSSRIDTDAILEFNGKTLEFELKSTSTGSVTTVRDFGYDHILKWKNKHWLIGVYDSKGQKLQYSVYGSPSMMKPWIDEKEQYILPDYRLSDLAPSLINENIMDKILGKKNTYSLDDAIRIQKKQYLISEYRNKMDLKDGYSRKRMLEILKQRCAYLIKRGSTLNNPHIPRSFYSEWEKITDHHSKRLRQLVGQFCDNASSIEQARL